MEGEAREWFHEILPNDHLLEQETYLTLINNPD
jgi:hypothetical protein